MKIVEELAKKHYDNKIMFDENYTYEKSLKHVKELFYKKQMQKTCVSRLVRNWCFSCIFLELR